MSVPIWLWGILVCIFATALTALGLVLQKLSHTRNEHSEKPIVYYRQPWWLIGLSIFLISQVLNLISMSMAPQVMLSCLGATALIFNTVFASLILGEELHGMEVGCMVGIACSVVMVIATTPVIAATSAPELILHEIVDPLFEVHFIVMTGCLFALLVLMRCIPADSPMLADFPEYEAATWTMWSAVSSGFAVNFFKATSEITVNWHVTRPLHHWQCYFVLLGAIFFGICQIHYLNRALNVGRAMMVVPTYFSLGLLAQLGISEAIVLDIPTTIGGRLVFACGVLSALVFIVLLVRSKIAYEQQPDAELSEVLEKALVWPGSPMLMAESSPKNSICTETSALLPKSPPEKRQFAHAQPIARSCAWRVAHAAAGLSRLACPRVRQRRRRDRPAGRVGS